MPDPKKLIPQIKKLPDDVLTTDLTIRLLNRKFTSGSFVDALGLDLMKAGDKVPESNGVPRIFLFRDGKVSSLEESGMEVGSRDFWQAAAKGHVFAYPAGEKLPVQLQLQNLESIAPDLTFSDPLDPKKLPQIALPREPRRPRWYHRVFPFGGNRKLCQEYDGYMAEKERQAELAKACAETVRKTYEDKRIQTSLRAEKQEAEYLRTSLAEQRQKKTLSGELNIKTEDLGGVQRGIDTAVSVYGPAPKQLDGLTGKVYTQKQFELLKPIDLKGAQVEGKTVTPREFACIALFAAADPELAMEAQKVAGDTEPLLSAFEANGYSTEESKEIVAEAGWEMYSRSLMNHRADTGNYFAPAVEPARQNAKKALDAYQRGDKGPLADILARTVGNIGRDATSSDGLSDSFFAQNQMAGELLDLMDRDPALKELAAQKYQQREETFHQRHPLFPKPPSFQEQMDNIRQVQEMGRLRARSQEAKTALLDAQLKDKDLDDDVKRGYVRDILKYNLVSTMYATDVSMAGSTSAPNPRNGAYLSFHEYIKALPGSERGIGSRKGGSTAPVSPKVVMRTGMRSHTIPKPDILSQIASPNMMKELDEGLDKLIQKDGLDKLSTGELNDKLVVFGPLGTDYTTAKLMDKIIDANIGPQEQPAETVLQEKDVQKAQPGAEAEMQEEQQVLQ